MRTSVGIVKGWQLERAEGDTEVYNAASLGKQVIGHLALELLDDLDEPLWNGITARHILSHTTGLPNWRPEGEELTPLRRPGERWGYSGEGFVLLQAAIERRAEDPLPVLARDRLFRPLGMSDSRLAEPDPVPAGLTAAADHSVRLWPVLGLRTRPR